MAAFTFCSCGSQEIYFFKRITKKKDEFFEDSNQHSFSKYNIYRTLQLIYKFFISKFALMILFFRDNNCLLRDVFLH